MKKICIVTGARSEWGLFYSLAKHIRDKERGLQLQIIATGMHLLAKFGFTYKEIKEDGFNINKKVKISLLGDKEKDVAKSTAEGIIKLTDAFGKLKPDVVLLLGDRFETFSAAVAAFMQKIPIVHLYGGELTKGAIDDALRHSITKMSNMHFVATEEYAKRVIQLGEEPKTVFNVGALGLDSIKNTRLLSQQELEDKLDFKLGTKNILVTFHPETLKNRSSAYREFDSLLKVLKDLKNTKVIITRPNSDMYSKTINDLINAYVRKNKTQAKCFTSLGRKLYLSTMQFMDVVAGNSSSGIIEVPFFGIPTVNIGKRQSGRVRPATVIDADGTVSSIKLAFKKAYSEKFRKLCKNEKSPYGDGNASKRIAGIIRKAQFKDLGKNFYDIRI